MYTNLSQFELVLTSPTLLMAKSLTPPLTLLDLWVQWPPTPVTKASMLLRVTWKEHVRVMELGQDWSPDARVRAA